MKRRFVCFALALGFVAACGNSSSSYGNLVSVSGSSPPSTGGVDTNTTVQLTPQANLTGQDAVVLSSYPNPWNLSLTQEPNVFTDANNQGYTYQTPNPNLHLYGVTELPVTSDVQQVLGNSSFMGALATLTNRVPAYVHTGIRYASTNADGSHNYAVRLYGPTPANANYTEIWVPTDDRMLTSPEGGIFGASGKVLWADLYQKAYAKLDSLTHQDLSDPNIVGYDTQDYTGQGTGLTALTGLPLQIFPNTGATDATSQANRTAFSNVLNGVNGASVLVGAYMLTANDLAEFPEYNVNSNSATFTGGGVIVPSPNVPDLYYTPAGGAHCIHGIFRIGDLPGAGPDSQHLGLEWQRQQRLHLDAAHGFLALVLYRILGNKHRADAGCCRLAGHALTNRRIDRFSWPANRW